MNEDKLLAYLLLIVSDEIKEINGRVLTDFEMGRMSAFMWLTRQLKASDHILKTYQERGDTE